MEGALEHRPPLSWRMQVPKCPVCWDLFNDSNCMPRILRCGHTVCESCISNLRVDSRLSQSCLECPECGSPCLWRGVTELPKNFSLLRAMNKTLQGGQSAEESYLWNIILHLPLVFSFLHFIVTETQWLQRMVKRRLWQVTRLLCLATLLLMLVMLSLAHMLLVWWVASLGFLLLIWFTAGGFGLGAFILCLWVSYNIVYIFLRINSTFQKTLADGYC